jgi:hypothetical protein
MNFKDLKNKIKEEQKQIAQQISRGKYLRKPHRRENMTEEDKASYFYKGYNSNNYFYNQQRVEDLSSKYRHIHIMYCHMFNGTPYDKIEQPRDENGPSGSLLDSIRKQWESEIDEETLRNCA